ncbi:MAG: cytochrome c biogenesis protein CcsA [Bacteroidales bacterium]|jgi:ABC-type transport system involved in cytochrome c biogenesis permease subunit|nr:cytochrome c biogenesis protein CcsA [Bacteroidales bacterium]HOL97744.1 cytochrome c biogenesis protein CcsA [Bacteroidales bacterium]HOM36303.1 cytochrome c biogenesis protein CcsA [Bacteroidales bacterium]HPD23587.1 cytochrome c biogenesis protein CcsA [Bacteroidales bacterium]HRS99500.1 cytochrome c biogenesis protein CcsA [Bacteroidales bacterium]
MWHYFVYFASLSITLWLISIIIKIFYDKNWLINLSNIFAILGICILGLFIVLYWLEIDRPPMRTMAETRLWYSFLVSIVNVAIHRFFKNKLVLILGLIMASVFLISDILHPEYQSRNLMPALQSFWFIPHVSVYMISYATFGSATILAISGFKSKSNKSQNINQAMILIYPGFMLLTFGMLFGALWGKIAWGDYWAWDPKETWALITWLFYLLLIHIHHRHPHKYLILQTLMIISFIMLMITWLGIKYLPTATQSIHVYGS